MACLQGVGVPGARGRLADGAHQLVLVAPGQLRPGNPLGIRHQPAELAIALNGVRHQRELVGGVKADEMSDGPPAREEGPDAPIHEDTVEEVLTQSGIVQPALLLDGKIGGTGA